MLKKEDKQRGKFALSIKLNNQQKGLGGFRLNFVVETPINIIIV